MHVSLLYAALATGASAHGVIRVIYGANGVQMPGLTGKSALTVLQYED